MRWRFSAAWILLAACSGSEGPTSSADLAGFCSDPNPADGSVCAVPVNGQVVDESGAAVVGLMVSACAGDCFFGTTEADGRFTVLPMRHFVVSEYALEVHGRPDHFSYYTPLPAEAGDKVEFTAPLPLPSLPPSGPEILGDGSAQTLTSDDLTVTIAAGTQVLFDVEDFGVPGGHQLRVRKMTTAPFIEGNVDALYACSPFEVAFSQKAALSIANSAQLPAGAAVEILSMVGLVNDAPPAGRMQHAATAHVSSDGTRIDTDAGEGVRELTWLALKRM